MDGVEMGEDDGVEGGGKGLMNVWYSPSQITSITSHLSRWYECEERSVSYF